MTVRDIFLLVVKRWYIVLLGGVLTLTLTWFVQQQEKVYFTQFNVVLLPPTYEFFPNKYADPQYRLSPLASVLVAEWNGEDQPLLTASSESTLYGMGARKGSLVRMPNLGNQWSPQYPNPTIDVQVVDQSPELVSAEADRIVMELADLLDSTQADLGVAPDFRASLVASAADPVVYQVSGSRVRTLGGLAAAGLIATLSAMVLVDRWAWRARREAR